MKFNGDEQENIEILVKKFKSIQDITVNFGRYDIVLYNYEEIEAITKYIEDETDIESWMVLKTRVNPEIDLNL